MINFPKTGSTFARTALLRIHAPTKLQRALWGLGLCKPALEEKLMRQRFFTELHAASNPTVEQHGAYCQIPDRHRHKPVMSVVRDPLERVISLFGFRSWARKPFPSPDRLTERYPAFPELSFDEFLDMYQDFSVSFSQPEGMRTKVGPLSTQFIRYYAYDPLKTILALRDDTDLACDRDLHFPKIRFLHTENLNQELHDYLAEVGYPSDRIAFILGMEKKNTSQRTHSSYLSSEQIEKILRAERFFFQLFPEYLHGSASRVS